LNAMTVLGEKSVNELGIILPHEHIFIDIANQFSEPSTPLEKKLAYQDVSMDTLGYLRRDPYLVRDNLIMSDMQTARREIEYFQKAGGGTIIDVTLEGIGRNPQALRELAQTTGIDIIAGSGFYTHDAHPPRVREMGVEEIADEIRSDIMEGIGESGVRAGVIGEIGTSREIHPEEEKVLRACGRVQGETDLPLFVHIYPWSTNGLQVLDILEKEGAALERIIICHSDVEIDEMYMVKVIKRGAFLEFDNFGKEFIISREKQGFAGGHFNSDWERVRTIQYLVDEGYTDRLLLTNDICLKIMLHAYGGWGYDHILSNVVPMLDEAGVSKKDIDVMIKENPRKMLVQSA